MPGQQLPSGVVLIGRYAVSRQTVQNAIEALRHGGSSDHSFLSMAQAHRADGACGQGESTSLTSHAHSLGEP